MDNKRSTKSQENNRGMYTMQKTQGISYRSPSTAPSPDFRVNEERPFQYTGIDYCGPVHIRTASHTEKNYIALMTCAATRIIHLELARDLSATSLEEVRRKERIAKVNVIR